MQCSEPAKSDSKAKMGESFIGAYITPLCCQGAIARYHSVAEPLSLHRNIDIAAAIPPDLQGYFAIRAGLNAHVVPAAIVDLLIRSSFDVEDHHHGTPSLKSAARQPFAAEAQLLGLPDFQRVPVNAI